MLSMRENRFRSHFIYPRMVLVIFIYTEKDFNASRS